MSRFLKLIATAAAQKIIHTKRDDSTTETKRFIAFAKKRMPCPEKNNNSNA
jgi:hypothetical protein